MDVNRHSYFNTNNLWFRLDRLKEVLDAGGGILPLPMIVNRKTVNPRDKASAEVFQLETAMGAAIECFSNTGAIDVPRSRFAPVKTTEDLLALRSDAYEVTDDFRLQLKGACAGVPPIVRLDDRITGGEGLADSQAEEIKQRLYNNALEERYNRWLTEDLREDHHVEIRP